MKSQYSFLMQRNVNMPRTGGRVVRMGGWVEVFLSHLTRNVSKRESIDLIQMGSFAMPFKRAWIGFN